MLAIRPDLVDPQYKKLPSRAGQTLDEVRTHDNLDLPPATLRKLMQTNAERVFGFSAG